MDLSVCITTYNLKNVLSQTIESVLMQKTNYNYEILIGDDGSIDGTIDLIKEYQKKYPRIISYYVMEREKDKKYDHVIRASSNRYNLLKHAKGKYITFLDGDDFYIDENKFQKQINILEKNSDCNLCAHNMNYYFKKNDKTELMGTSRLYKNEGKINFKKFWVSGFYIPAEACIFRNNFEICPENELFFTNYFDDNFIVYMALQKGKCYYMPDVMANYRQNENGYNNWNLIKREIINCLDLDMEIKFNKKHERISFVRHYNSVKILFKAKNLNNDFVMLYNKSQNDNAKYTIQLFERKFSKFNFLKITILYLFEKMCYKIFK